MSETTNPAADALRALCEPLLDRAEANLALVGEIEPEVRAHLANASRAGFCSIIAIRRIEARLALLQRMALGMATLRAQGPRLG